MQGATVKIHPACDAWFQGFKIGRVVLVGYKHIHVKTSAHRIRYLKDGRAKDYIVTKTLKFPVGTDLLEVLYDPYPRSPRRSSQQDAR